MSHGTCLVGLILNLAPTEQTLRNSVKLVISAGFGSADWPASRPVSLSRVEEPQALLSFATT